MRERPTIDDARSIAEQYGLDRVEIRYTKPTGEIGYASYGPTRELCRDAQAMADRMYNAAMAHFQPTGGGDHD